MIAFPVAHKNILLSNFLPQAAIHLKLKCKSLLIPWGHGCFKTPASGNLVHACQIDIFNLKPLKMYV